MRSQPSGADFGGHPSSSAHAEFCTSKQLSNGWFRDCCLIDASRPLLHTIAYTMQGNPVYREAMCKANLYLIQHHDIDNKDARLRGGVPGSWPVWADYGRLRVLNWATNFFVEALLLEKSIG